MHYAIIAAGDGSRLKNEGVEKVKPLVSVTPDGQPLIGRLLDIFSDCGAESVSVVVNPSMPEVEQYLRSLKPSFQLNILAKSTPSSLHTFAAVLNMIPANADKFIATTVDTIFIPEEFKQYSTTFEFDETADGYMGVTSFVDDEKPLYVETDLTSEMRITTFSDTPRGNSDFCFVSGGIYGLRLAQAKGVAQQCLDGGVSRMRNYQRQLVDNGLLLRAYPFSKIIDVDHQSDIEKARELLSGKP